MDMCNVIYLLWTDYFKNIFVSAVGLYWR